MPQGCILGPLLLTIYLNKWGVNVKNSFIHLYVDDTILYETVLYKTERATEMIITALSETPIERGSQYELLTNCIKNILMS